MRAYFFCNYYLSSLQQGLQAAHCLAEMFAKYQQTTQEDFLFDWINNHKTMIILNGGNSQELFSLYDQLNIIDHPYPIGMFREDEQSLNEAITCVGIILPSVVYDFAAQMRSKDVDVQNYTSKGILVTDDFQTTQVNTYDIKLANLISLYNLAR